MPSARRVTWCGPAVAVALWCLAFAALHTYWALGGQVGLAESAGTALAEQRPMAFVVFGLWGVAGLLLAAGITLVVLDLTQRTRSRRRLMVGMIAVVGLLLLLRGIAVEVVLLLDLGGIASAIGPAQATWSLLGWNPWFALGGLAFLALGTRWRRAVNPESNDLPEAVTHEGDRRRP